MRKFLASLIIVLVFTSIVGAQINLEGIVFNIQKEVVVFTEDKAPVYDDYQCTNIVGYASGEKVRLVKYSAYVAKVQSDHLNGWMYTKHLSGGNDEMLEYINEVSPDITALFLKRMAEVDYAEVYEATLKELTKKFGSRDAKRILENSYWIGMTKEMAELSLGQPDAINRTVTASQTKEQWVYRKFGVNLYFTNGICDAFQD